MLRQNGSILGDSLIGCPSGRTLSDEPSLDSTLTAADALPQRDAGGLLVRLLQLCNEPTSVALAIIDDQCCYVEVNQPFADLNGISRDAHRNRSICTVAPGFGPVLSNLVQIALQAKLPIERVKLTDGIPFAAGPLRDWLVSFAPLSLCRGAIGVACTVIEITESTRLENALSGLQLDLDKTINCELLTSREAEVLSLIGQGKTTKEIATFL